MELQDNIGQHVKVVLSGNGFALSFRAVADEDNTRLFFREREKGKISIDENLLKDERNCVALSFGDEDEVNIQVEADGKRIFKGVDEAVNCIDRGRIQKYDGWDDDERTAYESYANAEYIPADSPYEKIIKNEEEGYGPQMYGLVFETFDDSDSLLVHCAEAKITTVFEFDLANGEQFELSKLSLFREYDSEPSPLGEGCRFVDIIRYDNKIVFGKAEVKLKARQGYYMVPLDDWFGCEYLCGNKRLLNYIL